jgi:hypothetical protein
MAVAFPAIEPTEQPDFTMPEVPGSESVSVSGLRSYRQRGNQAVDAPLSLVFGNIPHDTAVLILACYATASWIEPLVIPPIVCNNAGVNLSAVMATPAVGLSWYFQKGSPPTLQRVQGSGGRLSTVQVRLRAELRLSA